MPSCREAAELLTEDNLRFTKRVSLSAHLLICSRCRVLKKQLGALQLGLRRYLNRAHEIDPELAQKIVKEQLQK